MSAYFWCPAGVLAGVFALVLLAHPLRAQTAEEIRSAATESVAKLGLQTDLPRAPPSEEWDLPWWLKWRSVPSGNGWVSALVLALIGGVLLYAFRDQLLTSMHRGEAWEEANAAAGERLTPESAARTSATADDLARQGLFREAMHVLLLRALTEMRQRRNEHFADSLTSREVLDCVRLPEVGHASLRDIIARVEWTYFGEHPAAAEDYTACRASFGRFVEALQKAPA